MASIVFCWLPPESSPTGWDSPAVRMLSCRRNRSAADRFRRQLTIRTAGLSQPVGLLSGGNQQKTMLAKWLNTEPAVLILDE
ncbi:MAG TPA: ATP-binding cassette domain-containing protein, partial [Acidimicrobiales bacterium]